MATETMKIKVLRAFYWDSEAQAKGTIIEVPKAFGQEMIHSRRAVEVAEEKKAPEEEKIVEKKKAKASKEGG